MATARYIDTVSIYCPPYAISSCVNITILYVISTVTCMHNLLILYFIIGVALLQSGFLQGLLHVLLLSMSAHFTRELGMAPGGEFRTAFREVRKFCTLV